MFGPGHATRHEQQQRGHEGREHQLCCYYSVYLPEIMPKPQSIKPKMLTPDFINIIEGQIVVLE